MAAADMLLHPEIETFQDSLERLCESLVSLGATYAISCPIGDPERAHVMADAFYTPALNRLSDCGYPYFVHNDYSRGLCAVVYVP